MRGVMRSRSTIEVVGVDGTPDGWLAVSARDGLSSLHHYPDIASLFAEHRGVAVIAIDIPLWFPTDSEHRPSDKAARKLLGRPRSSSVFSVPPREVLEARGYPGANRLSKKRYGRGISKQAYALGPKILQVVRFVESSGSDRFHEIHPELSFYFLAKELGGEITASKKTWRGFTERHDLLRSVGFDPPLTVPEGCGSTAPDDVLDACVAAWSAHRIATDTAELVGDPSSSRAGPRAGGHPPGIYA
jgi:predicted RNase H-like nuclease